MVEYLKHVPLFSSLNDEELEAINRVSSTKKFAKDTIILLEDEEGDTLFVILKGKVKVTTFTESGKEVIFGILSEGDFFGDMSLLDGKPRSATIIAGENSELQVIRRSDFNRIIEKHPRIALQLLSELTARLRKANERVESMAILDVTGCITGVLLQLGETAGKRPNGSLFIKSRPTHQELANMVGTTRETVTRVLKQLEHKGYITISGKDITIQDPAKLKRDLYI